jgi:hypothetical protein
MNIPNSNIPLNKNNRNPGGKMSQQQKIETIFVIKRQTLIVISSLILFFSGISFTGFSQISSNAQEVWPSIDAYLRLNQKWRLYSTAAVTRMDESSYADGAIGIFADYFIFPPALAQKWVPQRKDSLPGKFFWLRFGYQYSATPPSAEDPFKENMLVTESNSRFYLHHKMLLTVKNRFDWRFKNEDFNLRYRPRVTIERDMRTEYLTFTAYGFVEYFANFGNGQVDRLRSQFGAEFRVAKHINYEIFWNHQFENAPEVKEVDAFGMTLKFYYDKKDFKNTPRLKKIFGKKDKSKTAEKQ